MKIKFYEISNSELISYNTYLSQVSNKDLLELNSYKIRNILSIVFDQKLKDLVLNDLFNVDGIFLTTDTKFQLFRNHSVNDRNELKRYLESYLDYQIQSNWYNSIFKLTNYESFKTIIIPTIILLNTTICNHLKNLLPKINLSDWQNFNFKTKAIILDYNDSWKQRNILTLFSEDSTSYFLKHFFENIYLRKLYKNEKYIFNRLNTPLRNHLFGSNILNEIKSNLTTLKPKEPINEWDVLHEKNHNYSFNPQDEILLYFDNLKSTKYKLNSTFIISDNNYYTIKEGKELIENPELFIGNYKICNLDNLVSNFDLSKLSQAINKDKSISEMIKPLWTKYNLNETDGSLWKQLLKRKTEQESLQIVFDRIQQISQIPNFVSIITFENTYCNPMSETIIPREKKVFKSICQYLDLPLEYRAAIHRERNLIGGHSEELHIKLKVLLKSIINYKILENSKNDTTLFEVIDTNIFKIQEKVDMDYFGFTLDALKYACIEICFELNKKMSFKNITKIERVII